MASAYGGTAAGLVFDDDRRLQSGFKLAGERARQVVGRAARGIGVDQGDGARGPAVLGCGQAANGHGGQRQHAAADAR
ncbi:hypothetical protein D3C87_1911440 [compost metagenome]